MSSNTPLYQAIYSSFGHYVPIFRITFKRIRHTSIKIKIKAVELHIEKNNYNVQCSFRYNKKIRHRNFYCVFHFIISRVDYGVVYNQTKTPWGIG